MNSFKCLPEVNHLALKSCSTQVLVSYYGLNIYVCETQTLLAVYAYMHFRLEILTEVQYNLTPGTFTPGIGIYLLYFFGH